MNIQQYLKECSRTCPDLGNDLNNQLHMAIGASTEANEILDNYKRWLAYNKNPDLINTAEEIGDVFWYLINLCRMLSLNIEDILDINIKKLMTRYPNKFTQQDAINRNLSAERKVLQELSK
jgi:NTP pyrophosphatase (non-canonical NTP hydrolase)